MLFIGLGFVLLIVLVYVGVKARQEVSDLPKAVKEAVLQAARESDPSRTIRRATVLSWKGLSEEAEYVLHAKPGQTSKEFSTDVEAGWAEVKAAALARLKAQAGD